MKCNIYIYVSNVYLEFHMPQTQLLCSFTTVDELEHTLLQIASTYSIAFDTIYVLENVDTPCAMCCTYNIFVESMCDEDMVLPATISLHRKKATNTLYTINALNLLVRELNGGIVDRRYQVPWEEYKNTILVTAYGGLKKIHTKLDRIVNVDDYSH